MGRFHLARRLADLRSRSTDGAPISTRRLQDRIDDGLTLVELLIAFTLLVVLITVAASSLTAYLTAGTTVVSTYSAADQLLPSSMIIQRLIRSQVEPAPTPTTATTCAAANAPCPPFLTGSVGTFSNTFYANIGDSNGPAKIVMSEATPTECSGCRFYSSVFTVTEYPATANTCPVANAANGYVANLANICTWSATGKQLVQIPNVVNGAAPTATVPTVVTPLPNATTPVFTYNTLDPYSATYVPNNGGTPSTTTGILPLFSAACAAPTTNVNGDPTSANCLPDTVQSVGVDLEVEVQGSPIQENAFTVYRLSSSSYLYNQLVG